MYYTMYESQGTTGSRGRVCYNGILLRPVEVSGQVWVGKKIRIVAKRNVSVFREKLMMSGVGRERLSRYGTFLTFFFYHRRGTVPDTR